MGPLFDPAELPAPGSWEPLVRAFQDLARPVARGGCPCPFCITSGGIQELVDLEVAAITRLKFMSYVNNLFGTIDGSHEFVFLLPKVLACWALDLKSGDWVRP